MRLDCEDVLPLFEQQPVGLEVDQFGVATGMNRRRGVEGNRLIRLAGQASPGNLGAVQVGNEAAGSFSMLGALAGGRIGRCGGLFLAEL